MQRIQVRRSRAPQNGFLAAILTKLPGAWFSPSASELISLYNVRYRMALAERKYDIALVFLNKILEVDPLNVEAKLLKGELYHRHIGDLDRAIEQYNKVIRLTIEEKNAIHQRARSSLGEILELLS